MLFIKPNVLAMLSLSFVVTVSHSEVYKSITPDGRIVYTDNADTAFAASQDASKILVMDKLNSLQPSSTATTGVVTTLPSESTPSPNLSAVASTDTNSMSTPPTQQTPITVANVKASKIGDYRLTILSPTLDMAYRKPAQPVDIQESLSPSLKKGDRIIYHINDKHIATTQETQYKVSTQDYLPGQYKLTVKIENIVGDVIATQTRSFYILQNNFVLQEKRKAEADAKAAYDKLPWYKKIKININIL